MPKISYLSLGAFYVNISAKVPIYQKSYENKYINVHDIFWYSGSNSYLSSLEGKMRWR